MSAKNTTLTARETELVAMAWQCLTTEPKLDYGKFAELAGFKNAATASACWGPVKKKLMASADTTDGGTPKMTPTPKRKKPSTAAANEEETPTKKRRAKAAKAADANNSSLDNTELGNEEDAGEI